MTYGPGDSYSNPVLTTRFFSLPPVITKEIKEDTKALCLGETGTGGSSGMAVLEGYAALLEVRLHAKTHPDPASGLVHVARLAYEVDHHVLSWLDRL